MHSTPTLATRFARNPVERDANTLYTALAETAPEPNIKQAFQLLAEDEQRHRDHIEADLKKLKSQTGVLGRIFHFSKKG